jgi:hypothetical protein
MMLDVTARALNQPMSWFPDGKRLAFVKLVGRDELPKHAIGLAEFGGYFGESWNAIPSIYVLNIESGQTSFLHVGWTPVVSGDGKAVLVGGWDNRSKFSWNCYRLDSGESLPVQWPGDAGGAIALPADNIVLYKGLPTAGGPLESTKNNNEHRGPKFMIALNVALIGSDGFQTVVADFDPRDLVSFGRVLHGD